MADGDELGSGDERFTTADLAVLTSHVTATWSSATDLDWSVPAGTLEWSCLHTADHAVDCVWAPVFFLASQRRDRYPEVGNDMTLGPAADPSSLVESLETATRVLSAVIRDARADVRSVIFTWPEVLVAPPADFAPRAALELILHTHDVSLGLGVAFEPDADLCRRLREHTRPWPMWTSLWDGLARTDDPWHDLLVGTGRARSLRR